MFRLIIFVIMLGWVFVLSGCPAIDKGHNIEGENVRSVYPRGGYSGTTDPHKAEASEDCKIEANNLMLKNGDDRGDDRARRVYFSQCMLRNGYDTDGNYVGKPSK